MIKKMKMCFYRKSIDYMSVCMIWSMAQSDAYKHGALSVILQSGQQRLLGVTLCHSDPTQTHRTLPDLLSLDINRCLLFWGVSEQQLWRGIDYYTVYTPSLVLPRLWAAINACTSLCVAHTVQILKQMSQDRLSRTTHSHLTQLLPIVGWWGEWRFCLTYKKSPYWLYIV